MTPFATAMSAVTYVPSTFAAITAGAVGGAAAGAVSGFIMTGTGKGTLQGAASGAIMGGIAGYMGIRPQLNGWRDVAHQVVTGEIRNQVGRFAESKLGIKGWQLTAYLEAFSFAGRTLFGDAYHNAASNGKGGSFNYIGGFGDRSAQSGWLFKSGGLGHYVGEFLFDVNDQILQWQGIPDAGGLIAMAKGTLAAVHAGHSLGASRYATVAGFGAVEGGQVAALPFGMVAPGGVDVFIGTGDLVTGFSLGKLFNPSATVLDVPFITGHGLVKNYVPGMNP